MNAVFTPLFPLKRLDRQLIMVFANGFHWFGYRTQDLVYFGRLYAHGPIRPSIRFEDLIDLCDVLSQESECEWV